MRERSCSCPPSWHAAGTRPTPRTGYACQPLPAAQVGCAAAHLGAMQTIAGAGQQQPMALVLEDYRARWGGTGDGRRRPCRAEAPLLRGGPRRPHRRIASAARDWGSLPAGAASGVPDLAPRRVRQDDVRLEDDFAVKLMKLMTEEATPLAVPGL